MNPAATPPVTGWIELRGRTVLRLTGGDRVRYLNGQLTVDVPRLHPGVARQACVLTAKGKLCGVVFVAPEPDAFRIDAEPAQREEMAARLERYIVADDAALTDVTGETALFHWIGPVPAPGLPEAASVVRANRFGVEGVDLAVPKTRADEARAALGQLANELGEADLDRVRIERGVGSWGAELGPDTLPPEAGLDLTAIDYDKGCYLGQEIISRLRSVGRVNRALRHLVAPPGARLAPGTELTARTGETAGVLTSAAFSFALDRWLGLGYVRRPFWDPGTLLSTPPSEPDGAMEVEVRVPPRP